MSRADVLNLAWAAGIIDGEGCITIGYRKKIGVHQLSIRVVTKDPHIAPAMHDIFGGSLWCDKQGRRIWAVTGTQAAEVARLVRPFLRHKTDQADVAIQYGATVQRPGMRKDGIKEIRQELHEKLLALHRYDFQEA